MSVVMCSNYRCNKLVDTDFDDYDFEHDLCTECTEPYILDSHVGSPMEEWDKIEIERKKSETTK